ncbi:MAG: PAS domain S-box protein, partial [Bacteroidota bacterium]
MDLISCRNFLIYLDSDFQKLVLQTLHYALNTGGYLFLGNSEGISSTPGLFNTVNKTWKIYEKTGNSKSNKTAGYRILQKKSGVQGNTAYKIPVNKNTLRNIAEEKILNDYSPTSIITNKEGEILYIHGKTGNYLEASTGEPTNNIVALAKEGLAIYLSSGLRKVKNIQEIVIFDDVKIEYEKNPIRLKITFEPVIDASTLQHLVLIVFEQKPVGEYKGSRRRSKKTKLEEYILELEKEVKSTREQLQNTIEELETSNEELKSSNEEVFSANEELQSANEELETSKEELQSANEELNSLNLELQSKIEELTRANEDLQNYISSTEIGVIFLTSDLRVSRYTPSVGRIIPLQDTDIGRPINNIGSFIDYNKLEKDAARVLNQGGIIENELRVKDSIYWMRMHPYLSLKNLPEGVVITFTDITERINASEKINFQSNLLDSVRQSVIATCSDKKIIYWNDYAQELYGWKCHEVIGKDIVNIIVAEEEVSKSKEIVNSIVEGGSWTGEILMKRKDGSIFPALVTDSPIYDTDGNFAGIIGISIDISERKAIENSLRENENKYKTLFEQSADGVMILREVFLDVNQQVCDILGYEKKEIIGMSPAAFSPEYQPDGERTDEKAEALIKSAMAGKAHSFRWEHKRKDGEIIQTQINLLRIEISGKFFLQGTMRDITDQVNYENKINESNKKLNEILESISDGFFTLDNNLVVDYFNNAAEKLLNTPREEVLNKKLFDTFKVARGSVFEKKYKWAIEYKAYTEFEAYFEPYGEWFSVRVYPFESGISVYFQIVTEQKKAQQSLVESEKRFKTLVKETSHLIWVTEPDGTVSAPQPGWEKFTGQSFEDYKHDKWIEAIHPDDREYSLKEWGKSVETRSIYQITHRLIRNDGQYRSMQVKAAPVFDSAGNVKEWIGMHTDITEKIEYEKRLKESQERFKSLFDNSLTGIFYINANGDILEANDKVIELLGSPSIEATRKINVLKFKPLEKIGYTKQFRECIDTGKTMIGEAQYTSKWGKSMFVKYYFNPIRDHENNIIGVLANLDDISGIKEAEERLKENKRFIERITATIPGIVHVVDLSTFRNVYTNKPLGTLAEYTPGEIESMGNEMLKTILHPDDFVRIPHLIGRCQNAKDGEVLETEYRLIKKNGEEIWVHEWLTPFSRAKEGKVKEFLGIALDHTIRKKYEKELRGREYLLNEFQQIGSMGGWEYSTEKKKFFFTEQARRILSINSAIPPSFKILAKLFHAESRDKFSKAFEKAVKLGKSFDIDVKFPSLDEGVKWIRVIGSPVKENGKIHIVRGTFTDVTERKRVEKQLIAARNKAVESDRLKSAFLANMSHEIRTPMNGILGFSELLKNKNLSEKKREYFINLINNSGNHLLKIINDIIDISKIESNQLEIQKEKFDIDHLCRELLDVFHTSKWLKEKKLELHYVPDKSGKSPVINSDPGRLRQIIINLVENALKYTEQGKVEFGYTIENRQVIFKVKDTGDGIPENKLNQIFSRFWQDQEVIKKALGGTGLGLSITKGLNELLGGRVRVKSKTGRGTEFTFSFKYEPDVSGVKDHVLTKYDDESKKLEGKTLLVAEDDEVSYYYLKEILEPMGLKLVHAANGEDAVKFCHDNKNIDVILMDIQMPLMDGFDALKEIKTFAPGIPVIAQTAYAMVNERDRCYKAGFDEYIAKPVNEQ